MNNWINEYQDKKEIVLSTRIRLARNLNDKPFPIKLDVNKGREISDMISEAFFKKYDNENFKRINLWEKELNESKVYADTYLISKELVKNRDKSSFIINKDETVSIMINEEDHIRLQCFDSGFNLKSAFGSAMEIDDYLEENLNFAFREKLGYLTSCPTNIGTGMRASVMIHLPGLTMNDEMSRVMKALTRVGVAIRGMHGEGSKAIGSIYQISNQITLGKSEEEIIYNLELIIREIIEREYSTRDKIMKTYEYEIRDKVKRSKGVLQNAEILNYKECIELLSNLRFGIELGIIDGIETNIINKILIDSESSNIEFIEGKVLSNNEKDIARAKLVRNLLNN